MTGTGTATSPNRVLTLPPCDEDNPFATPGSFEPYFKAPAGTQLASVQIIYRDGSSSPVSSFKR